MKTDETYHISYPDLTILSKSLRKSLEYIKLLLTENHLKEEIKVITLLKEEVKSRFIDNKKDVPPVYVFFLKFINLLK